MRPALSSPDVSSKSKFHYDLQYHSTLELGNQEVGGIIGIDSVCQMGRSDDQGIVADHVTHGTVHLYLVLGIIGDLATVDHIASESEKNCCLNPGLEIIIQCLDRVVDDGGALAVGLISQMQLDIRDRGCIPISSRHDLRVRTLGAGQLEHICGCGDGLGIGVLRQEVRKQVGGISASHALTCDLVGAEFEFQRRAGWGPDDESLSLLEMLAHKKHVVQKPYHIALLS